MSTFKTLYSDLAFYLSADATGDTLTAAKAAINRAYFRILSEVKQDLLRRVFTLTVRDGAAEYGMPLSVNQILNIEDTESSPGALHEISAYEFDNRFSGRTDEGTADEYFQVFDRGVQRQPTSAGVISFVSGALADTGNHDIRITGFTAADDLITEQVSVTGTTSVSTTNSFETIERMTKSTNVGYSYAGIITVTDAESTPVTLASIPAFVESPTYKWVRFYPVPSAAKTYNVRCFMRKPPLINDDDWPEMPEEFHDLLLYDPGAEMLPHYGKPELASMFEAKKRERMKKFKDLASPRLNRKLVFDDVSLLPGRDKWPWWPDNTIES